MRKIEKVRIDELESKLSSSAFRKGVSAFRYGLIPKGYSDHLPVKLELSSGQFTAISWNMLADDHLYNNFMNVTGSDIIANILRTEFSGNNPYQNNLYHFFAELAQYLYARISKNTIEINNALLRNFVSLDVFPSRLARSRNPVTAQTKRTAIESARRVIVSHFLDRHSSYADEFNLSMQHALEIIYHIKSEEHGSLHWNNRFKAIRRNKALCTELVSQDIVCLQECTSPTDVGALFQEAGKPHVALTHRINDRTNDHCVLFYNPDKFSLVDKPIFAALHHKKPYIMAKLMDKVSGEVMVVSSIHHPGGNHCMIQQLLDAVKTLQNKPPQAENFYILGDFNNTADFYESKQQEEKTEVAASTRMLYPQSGSLAGSDFGNTNKAIDAVLTNNLEEKAQVSVLTSITLSPPAHTPLKVCFEYKEELAPRVSASFFQSVQRNVSRVEALAVATNIKVSKSTLSERQSLLVSVTS